MMICRRCGYIDHSNQISKRVERGGSQECASCLAKPTSAVKTAAGVCRPHKGNFDENDNPLDNKGRLFRAGIRLCGNRDCIAKSHILSAWEALEAERLDISYRTGKQLGFDDLLKKIRLEGRQVRKEARNARNNNTSAGDR